MHADLPVRLPSGVTLRLSRAENDPVLSEQLESLGHGLNTRCAGRGLCKGCLLEWVPNSAEGEVSTFRGCEVKAIDLAPESGEVRIPSRSLRDDSIGGVSAFELRRVSLPHPSGLPGIGLALDIGTTTIAGALWDKATGHCLATASVGNAQRAFGDDVLSRITFSLEAEDRPAKLQRSLVAGSLAPLLGELRRLAGPLAPSPASIEWSCCVAGNPTMLHTLAGLSLEGFSRFPFRPAFLDAIQIPARRIGWEEDFTLQLMPGLGPFVGADIAAGALALGLGRSPGKVLLVDFGTNGEILLQHGNRFFATATAAGPAFEGGRLRCGATAASGVVSSIRYDGGWQLKPCIPGAPMDRGMAGAAYIDALAEGLRLGWLLPSGRIARDCPGATTEEGEKGVPERRMPLNDHLFISEVDVAEILQAKAAIAGGIMTLLEVAGLAPDDLETVYVAGGFGYFLNPSHALAVGLLPSIPLDRVEIVGNSSLAGACLHLLSPETDSELTSLRDRTRVVELNQQPSFEDHFTTALTLGPFDPDS